MLESKHDWPRKALLLCDAKLLVRQAPSGRYCVNIRKVNDLLKGHQTSFCSTTQDVETQHFPATKLHHAMLCCIQQNPSFHLLLMSVHTAMYHCVASRACRAAHAHIEGARLKHQCTGMGEGRPPHGTSSRVVCILCQCAAQLPVGLLCWHCGVCLLWARQARGHCCLLGLAHKGDTCKVCEETGHSQGEACTHSPPPLPPSITPFMHPLSASQLGSCPSTFSKTAPAM